MPISEGFREIEVWASAPDAARTAPDDAALDPALVVADGWPESFSAAAGNTPRRAVMNWLMNAVTSALVDIRSHGVLPYDGDVDTVAGGIRTDGGRLWRALVAVGPSAGNAVAPTAGGQTVWAEVRGTLGVPAAPGAPAANTPGSGLLDWYWVCPLDGGAQVTEFEFRWRLSGGSPAWTPVASTLPTARFDQTGLTNGQAYDAQVRARNSQGWGPWSTTGTATATGVRPGGGPVLALRVDAGDGRAVMDWLEPDSGGLAITSYQAQWRTGAQAYSAGRETTVTATAATATGLTNGVEHFFRVRAVNSQGAGAWSNEASATPRAPAPTSAVPDRAAAPVGVAGQGEASWSWLPPGDNNSDIVSFDFRFRTSGSGAWTTRSGLATAARRETGLTNGQPYEAQVRARNGVGTQASWSPSGSATPRADVPDRIQHVELDNTSTGIRAAWGAPEANGASVSGYDVRVANNSAMTAASSHAATGTSLVLTAVGNTALSDGTRYYVDVRARNSRGDGPRSPVASLVRDDGRAAPDAPVGLAGTARAGFIDWGWRSGGDNGADVTSFEFQWRLAGAAWAAGNIVAGLTAAYRALAVTDTTKGHQARVRAVNSAGTSGWSAVVEVAPMTLGERPDAPAAPRLTAGDASIDAAWSAPADDGGAAITGWVVEYRLSGGGAWSRWPHSGTARTAAITGLVNDRDYQVRVAAVNRIGVSDFSPHAAATPQPGRPNAPTSLQLVAGDTTIAASWTAATGAASYELDWRPKGGADWETITVAGVSVTITGARTDAGALTNGTTYQVRVRARNSGGVSGYTAVAEATPATVPDKPARPVLTVGSGQLGVAWAAPGSGGSPITGYEVEYRVSGAWTDWPHADTATATTITGLADGTEYEVRVRASNAVGGSEWSDVARGTPLAAADEPDAPAAPTLVAGNGRLAVSWDAPADDGGAAVTDYDVRYRLSMGSVWTDLEHSGTARSATISGLTNGVNYDVQVRASNRAGTSVWSSTSVGTAIGAPSAPDAPVGFSDGPLRVAWRFSPNLSRGAAFSRFEVQWRYSGDSWSGNVLAGGEPYGEHAVADGSKDVEARCRAQNSQGWSGWSPTATFAKAGIETAVPKMVRITNVSSTVSVAWPLPNVSTAIMYATSIGSISIPTNNSIHLAGSGTATIAARDITPGTVYQVTGMDGTTTFTVQMERLSDIVAFPQPDVV